MKESEKDRSRATTSSNALGQTPNKPINDGIMARVLTILAVKIVTRKYLQRFWQHQDGVLFVSKFCIKAGPFTTLAEAQVMQFVANHTSIPVPKIYCAFTYRGQSYIVMERIDGKPARLDWGSRSEESKGRILSQLKDITQQLRNLTPPNGHGVTNIVGGPIYDCRLPKRSLWGPFSTTDDFHKELRNGIDLEADPSSCVPSDLLDLLAFYKQPFPKTALTHGDLSSLNILVKGDNVVAIIDWETAGWFPSYWEYVCAWNVNPQNEFWRQEVDEFLTPMPYELRMDCIRRKYFGDI
ncbi:kinase-like protein [Xylariaceae sp. AK1471]|nr:kinase-like protein [Xylariaceae sp. AK1471]